MLGYGPSKKVRRRVLDWRLCVMPEDLRRNRVMAAVEGLAEIGDVEMCDVGSCFSSSAGVGVLLLPASDPDPNPRDRFSSKYVGTTENG